MSHFCIFCSIRIRLENADDLSKLLERATADRYSANENKLLDLANVDRSSASGYSNLERATVTSNRPPSQPPLTAFPALNLNRNGNENRMWKSISCSIVVLCLYTVLLNMLMFAFAIISYSADFPEFLRSAEKGAFAGVRSDYGSPMAYGSKPTVETLDDVFRRLSPHQIIPSSEIRKIRVLGSGTFGEVALGEWLGTQVALKTQKEQVAQMKPDFKSEFQVELSVLSQLSHSKIVRYLGACLSPPIMVLEYYSMGSLDDVIHGNRAQLSHGQSLAIALDISLGMVYLHHKKVLHRDLKPQNVLVDGALQARIADFGLAKHPFVVETSENGLTGTVPYMAPEILSARPYGLPVDVYAYAVLVNEMLTKQRPYDGNSPEWVVSAVINTEARPLTGTSSPTFQNLIQKCWVKDPNARPKFAEVEIYLKNGIATTSNAQHISNSLVTTVSKLVSEMQLTNTTG